MFSRMLSIYTDAIFDKENISSKFVFTWRNKYMPVSVLNMARKKKKDKHSKEGTTRWNVRPVFGWISNANRGTNETTCSNSHLARVGNHMTVLNFFFRENFSLEKLHKGRLKRGRKKLVSASTEPGVVAINKTKANFCWVSRKWFRKSARKQLKNLQKQSRRVFNILGYRLRRKLLEIVRRKKVGKSSRARGDATRGVRWRLSRKRRKRLKETEAAARKTHRTWIGTQAKEALYSLL